MRFDERGLVPCVIQDWRTGEVLTLAYMNEEALRRTRETRRDPLLQPLARASSGTRARPRATCSGCASCATTATATRSSRWSSRPAPPATPASAPASTATSKATPTAVDGPPAAGEPEPATTRRCRRSSARCATAATERPDGSYTVELLDDPERIGEKVREEADEVARAAARGVRRAGRRGGGRRALPPRGAAASRGVCRSPPRWRCSMAVAAEAGPAARARASSRARELARDGNVIPVSLSLRRRLRDAGLGLPQAARGVAGPSFLLESAEQGRLGRYSFLGFRPRAGAALGRRRADRVTERRRADQERGRRPLRRGRRDARPLPGRRARRPAAVRRRRGRASSATTSCARSSRSAEPNPDPLGLPDMALMVCELMLVFDHLRHEVTILAYAFCDDEDVDRRRLRARRRADRRGRARAARAGPAARQRPEQRQRADAAECRSASRTGDRPMDLEPDREQFEANVARIVEYIHAGDAFQVVPSQRFSAPGAGRGVLDLPRPAHGQPLAVHVLPRVRRLPDRRRLAGAAGQGQRAPRRDAADRRHLPARRRRGGGPPPGRGAARRPEGARRARDARRPRPQRPRPRLRVRHRRRSTS